jgi:tRNA wybutosine-synthesizing protein 3
MKPVNHTKFNEEGTDIKTLNFLNKNKDKSPQGHVDTDIVPLLKVLNKEYITTSSCSGRITLMKGAKKGEAIWLYKSHYHGDLEKIYNITSELKNDEQLRFIFEPFIIHVKCETLEKAQRLLKILHQNGFRKSHLISFKTYNIEINNTNKIETIFTNKLSKEYIKILVDEANTRLQKCKKNIKKLEKLF